MTNLAGLLARADRAMNAARLLACAWAALVCQLAALAFVVLGTHGLIVTLERPCTTDFVSFFAAGRLADGAEPALVYDPALHYLTEQAATAPGIAYVHFFYPPVFLLICGLLAHLPYMAAFLLFEALTTGCLLIVLRLIVGGGMRHWWLPVLSFSPLLWNIGIGQNACLTASLFGCGTLLLQHRRPIAAGLLLSCLLFKPHTGLLVPVALAASGNWRAFVAAGCGICGLALVSTVCFGPDAWRSFAGTVMRAQSDFGAGQVVPFTATASVYGAARMIGIPSAIAYGIEAVMALLVVSAVVWSWRRPDDGSGARFAMLASGTLLIMPIVLFYDTVLLLVAVAWLLRSFRLTRTLPGERACLVLFWVGGLLCYPMTRVTHLPIALTMGAMVFALALARQARLAALQKSNELTSICAAEGRLLSGASVEQQPEPQLS